MGAFLEQCDSDGVFKDAKVFDVKSPEDGFVASVDAEEIAKAALELGAGRMKTDDAVDLSAGVVLRVKSSDEVKKGDTIARLVSTSRADRFDVAEKIVLNAYKFSLQAPLEKDFILERIFPEGRED